MWLKAFKNEIGKLFARPIDSHGMPKLNDSVAVNQSESKNDNNSMWISPEENVAANLPHRVTVGNTTPIAWQQTQIIETILT